MVLNSNLFPHFFDDHYLGKVVKPEPCHERSVANSNKNPAHFGIVAAAVDELGLVEKIDSLIPKTKTHNITHSQMVKAIIINGPGFLQHCLYLFPQLQ